MNNKQIHNPHHTNHPPSPTLADHMPEVSKDRPKPAGWKEGGLVELESRTKNRR